LLNNIYTYIHISYINSPRRRIGPPAETLIHIVQHNAQLNTVLFVGLNRTSNQVLVQFGTHLAAFDFPPMLNPLDWGEWAELIVRMQAALTTVNWLGATLTNTIGPTGGLVATNAMIQIGSPISGSTDLEPAAGPARLDIDDVTYLAGGANTMPLTPLEPGVCKVPTGGSAYFRLDFEDCPQGKPDVPPPRGGEVLERRPACAADPDMLVFHRSSPVLRTLRFEVRANGTSDLRDSPVAIEIPDVHAHLGPGLLDGRHPLHGALDAECGNVNFYLLGGEGGDGGGADNDPRRVEPRVRLPFWIDPASRCAPRRPLLPIPGEPTRGVRFFVRVPLLPCCGANASVVIAELGPPGFSSGSEALAGSAGVVIEDWQKWVPRFDSDAKVSGNILEHVVLGDGIGAFPTGSNALSSVSAHSDRSAGYSKGSAAILGRTRLEYAGAGNRRAMWGKVSLMALSSLDPWEFEVFLENEDWGVGALSSVSSSKWCYRAGGGAWVATPVSIVTERWTVFDIVRDPLGGHRIMIDGVTVHQDTTTGDIGPAAPYVSIVNGRTNTGNRANFLIDSLAVIAYTPEAVSLGQSRCGDGVVDPEEECDDGNDERYDGCRACVVEMPWRCLGSPSVCTGPPPSCAYFFAMTPDAFDTSTYTNDVLVRAKVGGDPSSSGMWVLCVLAEGGTQAYHRILRTPRTTDTPAAYAPSAGAVGEISDPAGVGYAKMDDAVVYGNFSAGANVYLRDYDVDSIDPHYRFTHEGAVTAGLQTWIKSRDPYDEPHGALGIGNDANGQMCQNTELTSCSFSAIFNRDIVSNVAAGYLGYPESVFDTWVLKNCTVFCGPPDNRLRTSIPEMTTPTARPTSCDAAGLVSNTLRCFHRGASNSFTGVFIDMSPHKPTVGAATCGNGVVEPWEQCDTAHADG
jgi:cysteine-rich repeat protein